MNRLLTAVFITLLSTSMALAKMPLGNRIAALPDTIIEVTGVIVAPPACRVNDDQPVMVDFEDIVIQQIDGARYARDIPVAITCDTTFKGELNFSLNGTAASFDSSALSTSNSNLGIKLILDGNPLPLNQWQAINWRAAFKLQGVPIKATNVIPAAGAFTATGTLMVAVQ